jgi:DNA-binding response OmpR family regulator
VVRLTPIEWRVLSMLVAQADRVVPTTTLIGELSTPTRTMSHAALARHVCNLRQKIGHDAIETIRLSGVRLRVRPHG